MVCPVGLGYGLPPLVEYSLEQCNYVAIISFAKHGHEGRGMGAAPSPEVSTARQQPTWLPATALRWRPERLPEQWPSCRSRTWNLTESL